MEIYRERFYFREKIEYLSRSFIDKKLLFEYFFEHKKRVLRYAIKIINFNNARLKRIFGKLKNRDLVKIINDFKLNILHHDNGKILNPYEREGYFALHQAKKYISMFHDLLNGKDLTKIYNKLEIKNFYDYQIKYYKKILKTEKEIKRAIPKLIEIKGIAHDRHVFLNEHHIKKEVIKPVKDHILLEYICDVSSIGDNSYNAELWHLSGDSKCTPEFRLLNDEKIIKIFEELINVECSEEKLEEENIVYRNLNDISYFKNFMLTFQIMYFNEDNYSIAEKATTYDLYLFDEGEFDVISKINISIEKEKNEKVLLSEICSAVALLATKNKNENFQEYFIENIDKEFLFLKPYKDDILKVLEFLEKPDKDLFVFKNIFERVAKEVYTGLTRRKVFVPYQLKR